MKLVEQPKRPAVMFSVDFREKVIRSLNEEEIDLYVLTLHYWNHEDLSFFSESDQKKINEIFGTLIRDTQHHKEVLELILGIDEGL